MKDKLFSGALMGAGSAIALVCLPDSPVLLVLIVLAAIVWLVLDTEEV